VVQAFADLPVLGRGVTELGEYSRVTLLREHVIRPPLTDSMEATALKLVPASCWVLLDS
jgi:hypothetical protein